MKKFFEEGAIFQLENDQFCLSGESEKVGGVQKSFGIYKPDFFLESNHPWISHEYVDTLARKDLTENLSIKPITFKWSEPDQKQFQQSFSLLKQKIRSGELKKGVIYSHISSPAKMTPEKVHSLLGQLLINSRELPVHIYGHWNCSGGTLGASPEMLFDLNEAHQTVETMACAGTQLGSENNLNNAKEQEEHQLVVDEIVENLKTFGSIELLPKTVISLSSLAHLVTPIRVNLTKNAEFSDLVRALHPTPALGVYPREKGMSWLRECAKIQPRHFFGAPFGIVTPSGISRCLVAIRNIQWNKEMVKIYAGCGIVAASDLDQEWAELNAKIKFIKNLFNLTD